MCSVAATTVDHNRRAGQSVRCDFSTYNGPHRKLIDLAEGSSREEYKLVSVCGSTDDLSSQSILLPACICNSPIINRKALNHKTGICVLGVIFH